MAEEKSGESGPTPAKLVILPANWPGKPLPVMPGDCTKYVPQGLGLNVPVMVRPWDALERAMNVPSFYGLDAPETDPIRAAPSQEPGGGVIYFDDCLSDDTMRAALATMGVHGHRRDFAAFKCNAADVLRERFLSQVRLISRPALHQFFDAGEDATKLEEQALNIEDAVLGFLKGERQRWRGSELYGSLGGDGDWTKESLAFGFLVENSYWGVYRVWSRPWLVTK